MVKYSCTIEFECEPGEEIKEKDRERYKQFVDEGIEHAIERAIWENITPDNSPIKVTRNYLEIEFDEGIDAEPEESAQ